MIVIQLFYNQIEPKFRYTVNTEIFSTIPTRLLTAKSLNGCISIPSGNRDLLSKDSVLGIEFNVHLKMLQKQEKQGINIMIVIQI